MNQRKKIQKLSFGQRLRELMAREDLTQRQLADAVGISQGAISHYLRGTRAAPGVEEAIAIASHFGVTIDWLLGVNPSDPVILANPELEARAARDAELEKVAEILQEQALKLRTLLSTVKKRSSRKRPTNS